MVRARDKYKAKPVYPFRARAARIPEGTLPLRGSTDLILCELIKYKDRSIKRRRIGLKVQGVQGPTFKIEFCNLCGGRGKGTHNMW